VTATPAPAPDDLIEALRFETRQTYATSDLPVWAIDLMSEAAAALAARDAEIAELRAECDTLRVDAARWRILSDEWADPDIYECVLEAAQLIAYKCQCSIALSSGASATDMLDAALATERTQGDTP